MLSIHMFSHSFCHVKDHCYYDSMFLWLTQWVIYSFAVTAENLVYS